LGEYQYFLEHLSRHRDLGHLNLSAPTTGLEADRPCRAYWRETSARHGDLEIPDGDGPEAASQYYLGGNENFLVNLVVVARVWNLILSKRMLPPRSFIAYPASLLALEAPTPLPPRGGLLDR